MQACTHFIVGAGIQSLVWEAVPPGPVRVAGLCVLGVASHLLLDDLARLTYHPPEETPFSELQRRPIFCPVYHLVVLAVSALVFVHWQAWWPGMLAALIPDADWIILRPLTWLGIAPETWRHGALHHGFRRLPVLAQAHRFANRTFPDWRYVPRAATVELALLLLLVGLVPAV